MKSIAKFIEYQRIININKLRNELTFSSSHKFWVGTASIFFFLDAARSVFRLITEF